MCVCVCVCVFSFYKFLINCQIFIEFLLQPVSIFDKQATDLHSRNLHARGNDIEKVVSSVLHMVKELYCVLWMPSANDLTFFNWPENVY